MKKLRPPICALCGHQVERFTMCRNLVTFSLVMVAECHGDREEARIDDRALHDKCAVDSIEIGEAFVPKQLIQPSSGQANDLRYAVPDVPSLPRINEAE